MKRSEINTIMRDAVAFLEKYTFKLPPFAFWSVEEWHTKGKEVKEIVDHGLGWDITDYGQGTYDSCGLFLFTLRNGSLDNSGVHAKKYAEKIMIINVDQIAPMHFHWSKTEDIINRGGGKLCIQLYNATKDETLADSEVTYHKDGQRFTDKAGCIVTLEPGESITLTPYLYHKFWGAEQKVLVGEVSSVNDDTKDNRFLEPIGRFPDIEEDEKPLYLLVNDYTTYYKQI
jgi:D-lyxose ketol-isomerase